MSYCDIGGMRAIAERDLGCVGKNQVLAVDIAGDLSLRRMGTCEAPVDSNSLAHFVAVAVDDHSAAEMQLRWDSIVDASLPKGGSVRAELCPALRPPP